MKKTPQKKRGRKRIHFEDMEQFKFELPCVMLTKLQKIATHNGQGSRQKVALPFLQILAEVPPGEYFEFMASVSRLVRKPASVVPVDGAGAKPHGSTVAA